MKLAMVAAKFSPTEANGLRRAMATFRNLGTIDTFKEMFVGRMIDRGYEQDFAERCFKQIEGLVRMVFRKVTRPVLRISYTSRHG